MTLYSHSRLETYRRCSEYYRLFYISDVPKPNTNSLATIAGSMIHKALESFYGPFDRRVSLPSLLEMVWEEEMKTLGMLNMLPLLTKLGDDILGLHTRASLAYNGPDAIRKSDGGVPRDATLTQAWQDASKALNVDSRQRSLDALASKRASLRWGGISLSNTFVESFRIVAAYDDPLAEEGVLEIEYPLSDPGKGTFINPVSFPSGVLLRGYIDIITTGQQGKLRIIDHKTSKGKPPSVFEVTNWEQLLLYGWSYHELTGICPDEIGINWIRTSTLVMAPFKMDLALKVVEKHEKTIALIEKGEFHVQDPFAEDSACVRRFGNKTYPCPYLTHCHPAVKMPSL